MQDSNDLFGFLLINKPKNITSYACVAKIKKILGRKTKIGHAGTLDLLATGLLIIGIDRRATKYLSSIMKLDKIYTATGTLGEMTRSLDYETEVIKRCNTQVNEQDILSAIEQLGSTYEQVPPVYSALKYEGSPLYKLVRHGKVASEKLQEVVAQKSRVVQLHSINLINFSGNNFTIKAHVSHGTYIRTLIQDIAERAGSCATTSLLERSAIGSFTIQSSIDLRELNTLEDIQSNIIGVEELLSKIQST